jgi:two-component system sensor histidine kinase KdpD
VAVAAPALVTLVELLPGHVATATAALLYVPAVLAVAGLAGPVAGSCAAAASFLGLNFFFTAPLHTLRVSRSEDVVALAVFFVVAFVVGGLFSAAVSARARTEKREAEGQLSTKLVTRLLAGDELKDALDQLARALVSLFGLSRCDVVVGAMKRSAGRELESVDSQIVPIASGDTELGRIVLSGPRIPLDRHDRAAVELIAGQLAIALERMRSHADAREARLDLESSQLRAALLSSVTHDLRTPLASITAAVTSLIDGGDQMAGDARFELLDTIKGESVRLNRLLSNLLDLSRLRAGALVPSPVKTSIDEILESVLARLRLQLEGRHVDLVLREGLPELQVDVVQIDQLLTNLIENAVKFSPAGTPIHITVAGWPQGVRVRIADRGPGIPQEQREKVFEPFVRAEGRDGGGTGLGLAIARAVALAHGGRLWLEGAPGGGTAAVLELPAMSAARPVSEPAGRP